MDNRTIRLSELERAREYVASSMHDRDKSWGDLVRKGERDDCPEMRMVLKAMASEAALSALPAVDGWKSIESAPKDGSEILGWRADSGVLLIRWSSAAEFLTDAELDKWDEEAASQEDWFYADFVAGDRLEGDCLPTHWQPLPAPPIE